MIGRIFVWLLITAPLLTVSSAQAQQTGKVFRIGFLVASTPASNAGLLETFRQEMGKFGLG